jgi:hypothetical protein
MFHMKTKNFSRLASHRCAPYFAAASLLAAAHAEHYIPLGNGISLDYQGIPFQLGGVSADVIHTTTEHSPLASLSLQGYTANRVHIIQWCGHAPGVSSGVTVGHLRLWYEDGSSTSIDLVLGVNTAEWAYDRPENQCCQRHAKVTPAYSFWTHKDSDSYYQGHDFYISADVESKPLSSLDLILDSASYTGQPQPSWFGIGLGAITLERQADCCDRSSLSWPRPGFELSRGVIKVEWQQRSEKGEWVRMWSVADPQQGDHFELRYYPPGAGSSLVQGYFIGKCYWSNGYNPWYFEAPDASKNRVPDCFRSFNWISYDLGADDDANGLLDSVVHQYEVCANVHRIWLQQYQYASGCGPPIEPGTCSPIGAIVRSVLLYEGPALDHMPGALAGLTRSDFTQMTPSPERELQGGEDAKEMYAVGSYGYDFDLNGVSDLADYRIFTNLVGLCAADVGYDPRADVNADGCITREDLQIFFQEDSDNDGMMDWEEYVAGTDPQDKTSSLRITLGKSPTGGVTLKWLTTTNRMYAVHRSIQPSWSSYEVLANKIRAMPPINVFIDATATNQPYYFYRVMLVAPPVTLLPAGSVWRYLDTGANLGTAWRSNSFNDTSWASGPAPLGYGEMNVGQWPRTTNTFGLNPTNKNITTYYRRILTVPNAAKFTGLDFRLLRDDGAIVYLNGAEVFRSNMPTGAVDYLTLVSANVGGSDETNFFTTTLSPWFLHDGDNLLAIEIHQSSPSSSDIAFDLEITADSQ